MPNGLFFSSTVPTNDQLKQMMWSSYFIHHHHHHNTSILTNGTKNDSSLSSSSSSSDFFRYTNRLITNQCSHWWFIPSCIKPDSAVLLCSLTLADTNSAVSPGLTAADLIASSPSVQSFFHLNFSLAISFLSRLINELTLSNCHFSLSFRVHTRIDYLHLRGYYESIARSLLTFLISLLDQMDWTDIDLCLISIQERSWMRSTDDSMFRSSGLSMKEDKFTR